MLLLQALVEGVKKQGEAAVCKAESDKDVVAKLTENDNIKVYFTTSEQLMVVYEVKKDKWAFKLAPQLVGKAQQAYAGLSVTDASDYDFTVVQHNIMAVQHDRRELLSVLQSSEAETRRVQSRAGSKA